MKFLVIGMLFFGSLAFAGNPRPKTDDSQTKQKQSRKFGKLKSQQKMTSLENVLENFKDNKGKMVSFEAVPNKVCEKKGCWMVLNDGEHEVRTLFKDYGFFVPKEIVGQKVRVQGIMEQKHITKATLRHYAKDAGKKMEEINKIKTGETRFQFVASGVEILEH